MLMNENSLFSTVFPMCFAAYQKAFCKNEFAFFYFPCMYHVRKVLKLFYVDVCANVSEYYSV